MKIFITLLIVMAIIMVVVGFKKQNRQMITLSSVATVGLLVLYMLLFRF
ncbi:hypothetical protein LGQ02_10325 [Bacillus shivajii]|nr:hypothetical protein [Bacillus shivajii]UCZ55086.1 hypothetical protein LGQ02_10325 [Bacillus shivajii]